MTVYVSSPQKLTYGVKEAAIATSLSRAFLFEKIASEELRSFKIANRRLIHAEDLKQWIDKYRSAEAEEK